MTDSPEFFRALPGHLFFTGKGGVGKTSLACATAVRLADKGKRILLVSTDPASNLDAVLGTVLGNTPTLVAGVPNLRAMNIDPEQAAREYRERTVAPYREVLPPQELRALEERLSGACTVEIAAFDEFSMLLGDPGSTELFDHVIFDTAPTGHTLRLLELPAAWTGFLEASRADVSCLGPLSGLKTQHDRYARTVKALSHPAMTMVVLVARPDRTSLIEAARSSAELGKQGMSNQFFALNGVFHPTDADDRLARAFDARGVEALSRMPSELAALPRMEIPLHGFNVVGLNALRRFFEPVSQPAPTGAPETALPLGEAPAPDLAALVQELQGLQHGLVMVMGKGGVGKTTIAAAIAVSLAHSGRPVHLTTTDPAQHIAETVQGGTPNLRVTVIDPKTEARLYRERVLGAAASQRSREQLALLAEELQSPCYEEVAVFQAFAAIVLGARRELVIVDTAPTGHTLLLLDTTGAYHRKTIQDMPAQGFHARTPLMLLQDREYTRILIVALPEATPVLEANSLQDDLRRAGIEPYAWVINASLAAARPKDPILRARAQAELEQIRIVRERLASRLAVIPFQAEEPSGLERLLSLTAAQAA
jgi:arsenite-transporting ATPase